MLKKALTIGITLAFTILLSGCMNLGNLSYKQASMLKKQGFVLTQEGWTLALPERLLFNFNDYQIKDNQKQKLTELAARLQQYNLHKIKFIGHTDNIGSSAYNQQLSEKRALNVASVFLAQGFQANSIKIIGKGAEQPLFNNDSENHRAENRRVNIVIIP